MNLMAFRGDLEALVLGALDGGAAHGYEIARRIKATSEEALAVGEGLLYPALHALEREGLVAAEWVPQEGRPNRKVYRLTDAGRGALARKRKEWLRFAAGVAAVLKPGAAGA